MSPMVGIGEGAVAHAAEYIVDQLAMARAGFLIQGTTLTHYCRANGIDPSWAWKVLKGEHLGTRSLALRSRILEASAAPRAKVPHSD